MRTAMIPITLKGMKASAALFPHIMKFNLVKLRIVLFAFL